MEKNQPPAMAMPAPPYPGPPLDYQPQPVVHPPVNTMATYQYSPQQPQIVQPVSQVVVVQQLPTDVPGQMMCPHCNKAVVTTTHHKNGMLTWVICGVLGVFICLSCEFIRAPQTSFGFSHLSSLESVSTNFSHADPKLTRLAGAVGVMIFLMPAPHG